ncbi:MAG: metal-dependent transcriptional regulator [Chitinophagaceae bacterium]|nr:metal-dependent transcriptional regulator [Chitinophagaceae bacterium]MCW5914472.1 metal-dependent transcriptional regulator [Chitinophagaceae bacterium]MCZ2395426.1 metal-dependent transcriptional regulator [Chitinophagales bacterium]
MSLHSHTKENYLKTLYLMSIDKDNVSINELAQKLGLKMPTVTSMMQKLAADRLVKYEKYKPIHLTEKGKKEAGLIIRKHRLTEMFLVEVMKFGWEEVHDIAEQIEHINSPVFFKKMDEMLGFPEHDPHGSPIPDRTGNIKQAVRHPLCDFNSGESVVITGLARSEDDFLKFLNRKNIGLGTILNIIEKEEYDGSMRLKHGKRELLLSRPVCEELFAEIAAGT